MSEERVILSERPEDFKIVLKTEWTFQFINAVEDEKRSLSVRRHC